MSNMPKLSADSHYKSSAWRAFKFEKAALRWLERYLSEGSPGFKHFAETTASLAKREPQIARRNLRIEGRELEAVGLNQVSM
jgi:hypothetical protein